MVQRYTEIPATQKICESLTPLLDNDKTSLSCNSGTTFPTTNLVEGMLCFRTDEKKLYQLTDTKDPVNSWRLVADLTADFRHLEGGNGNAINYDYKNLNDWKAMPTGFYEGVSMLNAPPNDDEDEVESRWRVLQFRHGNADGWATQVAFAFNKDLIMTRTQKGGDWTEWVKIPIAKTDGSTVEGLNSDRLDGYHAGNEPGSIPISNGTLNENLNADLLDGFHAGNGQNEVPVSNTVKNLNLNADLLDGFHAGNKKGQIPVANGTLCEGLNAESVGGYSIKRLVTQGEDGKVTGQQFGSVNVQNVDQLEASFSLQPRQTTTKDHELSGMSEVNGAFDYVKPGVVGSGNIEVTRTKMTVNTLPELSTATNYKLKDILKALAKVAHSHQIFKETYRYNCNCDCRCDCSSDCSDDNCN